MDLDKTKIINSTKELYSFQNTVECILAYLPECNNDSKSEKNQKQFILNMLNKGHSVVEIFRMLEA